MVPETQEDSPDIVERKKAVQSMFNGIARRYDLLNHLLSAGIDVYWRRRALGRYRGGTPERVLDLATGTGDFALAARRLKPGRIVGADVAIEMVRLGVPKVAQVEPFERLRLMGGDAECLPYRDDCFDLITVAFGVRNFGHIPTGLAEAFRVLRPGGELIVLDFTEPTLPGFRQLYQFYFKHILPTLGGWISGNRAAYSYLPRSVGTFPQGKAFLALLGEAGFCDNRGLSMSLGICAVYQGLKSGPGVGPPTPDERTS